MPASNPIEHQKRQSRRCIRLHSRMSVAFQSAGSSGGGITSYTVRTHMDVCRDALLRVTARVLLALDVWAVLATSAREQSELRAARESWACASYSRVQPREASTRSSNAIALPFFTSSVVTGKMNQPSNVAICWRSMSLPMCIGCE